LHALLDYFPAALSTLIRSMIIVVGVEGHSLEQVIAQLDKLISVISIKEILTGDSEVIHDTQPDYQN
jgi:acetolactate synthase small subunit